LAETVPATGSSIWLRVDAPGNGSPETSGVSASARLEVGAELDDASVAAAQIPDPLALRGHQRAVAKEDSHGRKDTSLLA
jgi:hypothetical protein